MLAHVASSWSDMKLACVAHVGKGHSIHAAITMLDTQAFRFELPRRIVIGVDLYAVAFVHLCNSPVPEAAGDTFYRAFSGYVPNSSKPR